MNWLKRLQADRHFLCKYETGESLLILRWRPAEVLDSLDELVNYDRESINNLGLCSIKGGKYVWNHESGEKGQIVILAKVRKYLISGSQVII